MLLRLPYEAKIIVEDREERKTIRITVDGVQQHVLERITMKEALKLSGYEIGIYPMKRRFRLPAV